MKAINNSFLMEAMQATNMAEERLIHVLFMQSDDEKKFEKPIETCIRDSIDFLDQAREDLLRIIKDEDVKSHAESRG